VATRHLYYDIINGNLYTGTGDFVGNNTITVYFANNEEFTLHYVKGTKDSENGALDPSTWDKWTDLNGLTIGSTIAFDNDYIHAVRGTLVEPISVGGTSATVAVDIQQTLLNPSDKLTFFNADGSNVTLLYSSYTETKDGFTFNFPEPSTVDIPSNVYVRVPQALYVKISDVDCTRASEGIFSFSFNAYSHKLLNSVDFSNVSEINGTFEHQIMHEGNRIKTVSFPFAIRNVLDFDNDAVMPSQEGDWVDKAYVQSFFTAEEIYQYSVDGVSWHDAFVTGDVYYRSKINTPNAVWSATRNLLYGVGIKDVKQTVTSEESGGENIVTITLDNGDTTDVHIYKGDTPYIGNSGTWVIGDFDTGIKAEGRDGAKGDKGATGTSITNVEQTTTSTESGGTNVVTVTLSDGTQKTFNVWNGAKGDQGIQGEKGATGEAFKFDALGTLSEKDNYNDEPEGFAFLDTENGNIYIKNSETSADWTAPIPFRGEQGVSITKVEQTTTSTVSEGTNVVTVTLSNGQTFTFNVKNGSAGKAGEKGAAGSPGVQGPAGKNGLTPYIGEDKNWWIGGTNTGVLAEGGNQFANGIDPFEFTNANLSNGVLSKTFSELGIDSGNPVSVNIISGDGVIMDGDVRLAMVWTGTGLKVDLSQFGTISGTWKLVFAGGTKITGGGGGAGSGDGYTRTIVSSDSTVQSGYWYTCISPITLTLPAGNIGDYVRISTNYQTENVVVIPSGGESIDGDTEGFTLDKTSGTVEFLWDGVGWTVIEAK
jgi:hypothetical protein